MKRIIRPIRCVLLAIFLFAFIATISHTIHVSSAPTASEPNKYALLVGISKYHRGNAKLNFDWGNLNTKGDLEILSDVLIRKFEFKPENIKIICDEPVTVADKIIPSTKPTRKAIEEAFKSALTDRVVNGDVAYFHYSGHGSQAPDDAKHGSNPQIGDEADGMDETIIPADYVSQTDSSGNIRDDSISEWLAALNAKGPSNVTITLDSCHSGTATRGDEVVRGSPWKGDPVNPKLRAKQDDSIADLVTRRGGNNTDTDTGPQNYIFFAAASPTQSAKEHVVDGIGYGKFTYNLAKIMETAGPTTTYRDLFENVWLAMTRDQRAQTPQIDGRNPDQLVFSVGALPVQAYVPVAVSGSGVYLKAGRLQGMSVGSVFALYPAGARQHEEGKELAKVEIDRVNPMTSTLKLPSGFDAEKLKTASRAFEIQHSYSDALKVAVRGEAAAVFDEIFKQLSITNLVPEKDNSWNVLVRPGERDGPEVTSKLVNADFKGYVLERHDGSLIKAIPEGKALKPTLMEALKGEATWQLVNSFGDTQDNSLIGKVEISMVPVKVDIDETTGETLGIKDLDTPIAENGGKRVLRACEIDTSTNRCRPNTGDTVRLVIRNAGDGPLWVTILNLRSDGKIDRAFPDGDRDNKIAPGSTFRLPNPFRFTPPYGEERFFAIITRTETDFTPLIDPALLTRGPETERGRNADASPMGKMLRQATRGQRGDLVSPPPSWAITYVMYYVIPPAGG